MSVLLCYSSVWLLGGVCMCVDRRLLRLCVVCDAFVLCVSCDALVCSPCGGLRCLGVLVVCLRLVLCVLCVVWCVYGVV